MSPQYLKGGCTCAPGVRESQLQKALLRVRPKLPTEASLAAATAAAAAAAQQAKHKALEAAQPTQASLASLTALAKPDTLPETHPMVQTDPPAQTDPLVQTELPALTDPLTHADPSAKTTAVTEASLGAVSPPLVPTALEGGAPDAMDTDMPDLTQARHSEREPEAVKAEEAAQSAESDRQPNAELPLSDLEKSVTMSYCCMSCRLAKRCQFLLFLLADHHACRSQAGLTTADPNVCPLYPPKPSILWLCFDDCEAPWCMCHITHVVQ